MKGGGGVRYRDGDVKERKGGREAGNELERTRADSRVTGHVWSGPQRQLTNGGTYRAAQTHGVRKPLRGSLIPHKGVGCTSGTI